MKKVMSLLLAAVFVLFNACGSDAQESMTDAVNSSPSVETSTSAASAEDVEAAEESNSAFVQEMSAEDVLIALRDRGLPIGDVLVWDEVTDLNGKLGRPGCYIGKADFQDTRVPLVGDYAENGLSGGTIEVFDNIDNCKDRYEYLSSMQNETLGALGVNQYIYTTDYAILRVSYDVPPSEAEAYESAFMEIWGNAKGKTSSVFGLIGDSAAESDPAPAD